MGASSIRVGINGYGRIGRAFHRLTLEHPAIQVVAVNSRSDAATLAHLLRYDSIYGRLNAGVVPADYGFSVEGQPVHVYQEPSPATIPWEKRHVEVIIDATGRFKDSRSLSSHLRGDAHHVILCCPPKDDTIPSVVVGVNDDMDFENHPVLSNASCTTNAITPMLQVMDEAFGVAFCSFRTIHALTDSQRLLDNAGEDPRRGRAAMESIIPTSTGASSLLDRLFPHLGGKIHGLAYRAPTRTVSNLDLTLRLESDPSAEAVNQAFTNASTGRMAGILGVCDEPLVSIDFKGDPRSVIVDTLLTTACGEQMYALAGFYDNEWGYAARLVDLVYRLSGHATIPTTQPVEEWLCARSVTA